MRQFSSDTYLAAKAAFRTLVTAAGGPKRVSEITRALPSTISKACAPQDMDHFPALDQILDLEADTGRMDVTAMLADLAGYNLVPRVFKADTPASMFTHLATIVKEVGDVEATLATALSSGGVVDAVERVKLKAEVKEALAALQGLLGTLEGAPTVSLAKVKS